MFLSYKQVAPPIIMRAYAHQLSRLMPTNIPARSVNSGFSIGLGGEHLTYDHFKMYIDQGVHFQIIINKSILLTYSLSLVCKAKMLWNAAGPTNFTSNLFYCMGMYVLSFGSSFACFHVFCFRYKIHEPLTILAGQKAPRNKQELQG